MGVAIEEMLRGILYFCRNKYCVNIYSLLCLVTGGKIRRGTWIKTEICVFTGTEMATNSK